MHLHVTRWYFKCVAGQSWKCFMKCMYDEYVMQIQGMEVRARKWK